MRCSAAAELELATAAGAGLNREGAAAGCGEPPGPGTSAVGAGMAGLNNFMRRILGGGVIASNPRATPGATAAIQRAPNVSSPYNARADTSRPRSTAVPRTVESPRVPAVTPGAAVASLPNATESAQGDSRTVLGAGPSVSAAASPFPGWFAPMTFPIPPRQSAVPGWPLQPQPDLPLPRRMPEP